MPIDLKRNKINVICQIQRRFYFDLIVIVSPFRLIVWRPVMAGRYFLVIPHLTDRLGWSLASGFDVSSTRALSSCTVPTAHILRPFTPIPWLICRILEIDYFRNPNVVISFCMWFQTEETGDLFQSVQHTPPNHSSTNFLHTQCRCCFQY